MSTHSRSSSRRMIAPIAVLLMSVGPLANTIGAHSWPMGGLDLENTRNQKSESKIDADSVVDLDVKWATMLGGDISATPAVDGKYVYVPDWSGLLNKLDRETGELVWSHSIADYTRLPGNLARTTPAVYEDLLIFGDQGGRASLMGAPGSASLMAVDKQTGALVWLTQLDPHPAAVVTQSATIHRGVVYVGVSSLEEAFTAFIPGYPCCSFRGSMLAVDANTGEILWRTYTVPPGYSGNAIWGSSPAIDKKRKQLYIATGNNYSAPDEFLFCIEEARDDEDAQRDCLVPDNYFDAILALDMDTGAVNWSNVVIPFDVFTLACVYELPTCPDPEGPDSDFGQAPMLMKVKIGRKRKWTDLVGVGQKSGVFWALDADTGDVVWSTKVSPGGRAGGLQWGSAFDGKRVYTSSTNSRYSEWTLPDGSTTTFGIWSALDAATGEILWQRANPALDRAGGAVSVANGVVYACSLDPVGRMYAMDAATGDINWSFDSGGSCNAGAAIAKGTVYWGSGYQAAGLNPADTPNDIFRAFALSKARGPRSGRWRSGHRNHRSHRIHQLP